ncbi:MAG: aminotransferase class I/II-fold pyridoxal phosphate-dependent enzyme [Candidatus Diapherotrites archaeon]|nr:aminotransferase class I/II-fold pyridoxal phosphate-dependent enzyme [Candidatus Diapherotrites archaeon]
MFFKASKRSEKVSYAIRDIVVEASKLEKQGKKVLYLNIGDPLKYDFRTPEHLWKAVFDSKQKGESYAPSEGIKEAREAIAENFNRKGMRVEPENVLLGNGSSELIWFAMSCVANPGESILLPRPCYPVYSAALPFYDVEEKYYDLDESRGWQPDIESIRKNIDKKTKAIVVINPNNPTGTNYSKKTLEEIISIAAEHKLVIFSDEIYDELLLDEKEKHYCMGALAKDVPVIVANGLSKNYLATGFRMGWIAPNEFLLQNSDIMDAISRLARARLCAVHPFQYAIKPALEGSKKHIKDAVKKLRKRRDYSVKRLNEIKGISCQKPNAAFYAFPKIELPVKDDKEFALGLLREKGVCVVHGSGFGQKQGTKHFRIVILPPLNILEEAFNKIEEFARSLR